METIIGALISAGAAIAVCVITSYSQNKKVISEMEKHNEVQNCKIDELTRTVDKHNKVIERVYKLEQHEAVINEKIAVANHRIEDLEHFHK